MTPATVRQLQELRRQLLHLATAKEGVADTTEAVTVATYCNSSEKFSAVDDYVHLRIARLAAPNTGSMEGIRATRFTYRWLTDLGIYRLSGKVRYYGTAST